MIDPQDIDDYAAEYVLGTLDHRERIEVTVLRASDAAMDAAIRKWETLLAPLNEVSEEVAPSSDLLGKIELRVLSLPAPIRTESPQRGVMRRWLALALVASLAFLFVTGSKYLDERQERLAPHYVALLQKDEALLFVVSLNDKAHMLNVHTETLAAPDKSYELWLIPKGGASPKPIGVLHDADSQLPMIELPDTTTLTQATLAVSVEPFGGSPSGAPTGPVIVTGKFEQASL